MGLGVNESVVGGDGVGGIATSSNAADGQEMVENDGEKLPAAELDHLIHGSRSDQKSVAFLTKNEALRRILERVGSSQFLPTWTEDDCAGLLVQLSKTLCDKEGAQRIIRYFRDTTVDEVLDCFNDCKEINKRAGEERSCLGEFTEGGGSLMNPKKRKSTATSWPALMVQAKKSRGVADESGTVIANYLTNCSLSDCPVDYSDMDSPDFKLIYSHLSSIVQGYSLKGIRSIDAAIILEIFGEMARDINSKPELVDYFKQMFADLQHFPKEEFKLDEELDEENAGRLLMNHMDFPEDLLDLSRFYGTNNPEQ